MTTTRPSLLVVGPYATYDFPNDIDQATAMMSSKTLPQTRRQSGGHMEWKLLYFQQMIGIYELP